eukprot:TRINITY_DN2855_c0_g1_i1.p2 TRINITY_DN2855_c0_g1~~TRINITY_DN2855_c0_g1_i1.p2  ORF type:complete len:118 (-),score=20.13 TRINITY_DN2855_c0_g1_i1:29-382(-)
MHLSNLNFVSEWLKRLLASMDTDINGGSNVLPPDQGTLPDWVYETGKSLHSMTLELRGTSSGGYGFLLPESQIKETGEEILQGMKEAASFLSEDSAPKLLEIGGGAVIGIFVFLMFL